MRAMVVTVILCFFALFGCNRKDSDKESSNGKKKDSDSALEREFRHIHGNRLLPAAPEGGRKKKE